jgi:hypothetical protein
MDPTRFHAICGIASAPHGKIEQGQNYPDSPNSFFRRRKFAEN